MQTHAAYVSCGGLPTYRYAASTQIICACQFIIASCVHPNLSYPVQRPTLTCASFHLLLLAALLTLRQPPQALHCAQLQPQPHLGLLAQTAAACDAARARSLVLWQHQRRRCAAAAA
jgi:hypothetical protein